jgi:hypothetical protein
VVLDPVVFVADDTDQPLHPGVDEGVEHRLEDRPVRGG